MRVTASEKALYQSAQEAAGYAGSADLYRNILAGVSELTLKLRDGEITPGEFQVLAGALVAGIVVPGVQEMKEQAGDEQ